jgi:hypothetical protein
MSQAPHGRRKPPKEARRIDWEKIAVCAAIIIRVGWQAAQDWIGRGGHI